MLVMDAAHRVAGMIAVRHLRRKLDQFRAASHRVRETSRDLLAEILASASESQFGRDHHFSKIRSVADFRRSVPVASYAYHAPYIERLKMGQRDALFDARQRVLMFALTSRRGFPSACETHPNSRRAGAFPWVGYPTYYDRAWDDPARFAVPRASNLPGRRVRNGVSRGCISARRWCRSSGQT